MKKIFYLVIFLLFNQTAFSHETLKQSEQMVVVVTPDWNANTGTLQRFERASTKKAWKKMGNAIPVVVGKNGMAWGADIGNKKDTAPIKQEGDGRTPAGIYLIGPGFGFAEKSGDKLDYFPLTETSVCVDDVKSNYYNQLLDSTKVPKIDWNSGEQMRQVPQYKIGSMVQYNTQKPIPGAGSCIFLHIWKSPTAGTAGCIATEESNLTEILHWLDSRKEPMIVLISQPAYDTVKTSWKLPNL